MNPGSAACLFTSAATAVIDEGDVKAAILEGGSCEAFDSLILGKICHSANSFRRIVKDVFRNREAKHLVWWMEGE